MHGEDWGLPSQMKESHVLAICTSRHAISSSRSKTGREALHSLPACSSALLFSATGGRILQQKDGKGRGGGRKVSVRRRRGWRKRKDMGKEERGNLWGEAKRQNMKGRGGGGSGNRDRRRRRKKTGTLRQAQEMVVVEWGEDVGGLLASATTTWSWFPPSSFFASAG